MNEIEEKLWNYIDGFCSEEEQKAVETLIKQDENYRSKYAELMAFQKTLTAVDLEEPSMGFTFKVMENIRAEHAGKPLKSQVNKRIIFGIAAFFVCTIVLLLTYIFANIDWTNTTAVKLPEIKLPSVNSYLSPVVIKGFMFFDVILGLFFLDHYFRRWFFEKN